jgi:small ligand-binding sensory domain FIST
MQQFMFASAQDDNAATLIRDCLAQIGEIPPEANLGFLYATDQLAGYMQTILAQLQQESPSIRWVGTVGMGICSNFQEIYDRPAVALMIGSFADDSFRILPNYLGDSDTLPQELVDWYGSQNFNFALLHGDPSNPETAGWLDDLAEKQTFDFINGGLTSSGSSNPQLAGSLTSGGISGVLFNEQVQISTDHTQGCSPIGPPHQITKSERNIAFTLDQRPALEVMKEDMGEVLSKDLSRLGGYIFAALPIAESDTGDYLVRQLVGIDPENQLLAIGDMLENQQRLMFCRRDGNTAREDMQRMLQRISGRVGEQCIRGGIYISCLGRGRYQFGDDSEELKMIQQQLGDFPLVGFFANGEIYNGRLYGYTGVLTLFL